MHVLVVDDEPVIRNGLVKMTEQYTPPFARISMAENGIAALERIRAEEPDIVLTDIRMPKMDGLELCRIVQHEYPHIKLVVISGYNDFEYAQACMAFGVKIYLLKPVTKSDVHSVFDRLVREPSRGYMPPSRYVEWIDGLEQHIWNLRKEQLVELAKRWREYCLSAGMSLAELKGLLDDCHSLLAKRFQERKYAPAPNRDYMEAASVKEALDAFETGLLRMTDELQHIRSGHFRDPLAEAKAYIDSRLSQDISLEQVAAMVGLTPTYFSALFKKMTNETFVKYRIHKRMERAKELLAVPHIRIVDVAAEVGYDDYPHFTKTFKKIVGISPSDYRSGLGIK
ncbi:response regulator transcription factor [Paenibacillus ginsengarvi]|uniref:Response regulator n=1 Tax=Paenibacillus ginsengarvi TaxID=400777 RepID=A0A3B0C060_9BACL|nr:response regulator [Paenibacillus ginsengarvi]RKN79185.1 response regulator [Paenibacillus ginsengarvi]